jgi:SSS family solute:Na+ symporter
MDFYKNFRPEAPERELVLVGRLATTVLVILGILWVPFIHSISSQLFVYLQSVQAYVSPPIAAVFILGIFWRRVNGKGAIYALITGAIIGALRLILEIVSKNNGFLLPALDWFYTMNFLHFAIFLFIVSSAILVGVSLLTSAPGTDKLAGLTFATVDSGPGKTAGKPLAGKRNWMRLNIGFSIALVLIVLILWTIFF